MALTHAITTNADERVQEEDTVNNNEAVVAEKVQDSSPASSSQYSYE
mgnify:CR=1 FL=1